MKRLLTSAVLIAISAPLWAASITWNATSTDFNDGSSWVGGTAPGTGDNARFVGAFTSNQPGLTASTTIQGLTFNGTGASGYTLSAGSGFSLTLTNTGGGANGTINAENTSGTNTISAPIILGGAAGSTATFTQAAGGTLEISGNISSTNAIDGLNLAGSSGRVVTLSGSNTYAGDTIVATAGLSLNLGNAAALSSGTLRVNGTTTLNATAGLSGAVANPIGLNATLTLGGSQALELSGDITLNNNRTITVSNTGSTELSGSIALSNSADGRTLTIGGGEDLTLSGAISNGSGSTGNLVVTNTATVSLTGTNSSYNGTTKLYGGTGAILEVTRLANGGVNSSIGASSNAAANLLLPNNSTLRYVGTGDSTDRLFTIAGTNNGHKATLDASGTGAIHFTNTGSLAYGTINQARVLTLNGANTGDNSLAAAVENNGTGATTVEKDGTGRWILKGTNTYTGKTNVNAGTLQFGQRVSLYNANTSYWATSNITVASGATLAFNVGGTGEFTSTDIDHFTAMGSPSSGYVSGSFMGLDTTNASGGVFTHSGVISNPNSGSNTLGLKKLGTGTLELTGDNTYTGATTVAAGTLLIQGAHSGAGAVTVQSGAAIGGGGIIAGNLTLDAGANFVFSLTDTLTVNGASVSFGGFGISNVLGLDGSVAEGTYTLINGSATFNFDNVSNWGAGNATSIGGGKQAYFQEGSLQVVVIPEPGVLGLLLLAGGLGLLARRHPTKIE